MNILLATVNYPPEIGAGAHVIYELAFSLQALGHNISVITGFPRYNLKDIPAQYHTGLLMNEVLDGIPIRRIRIPSLPRTSKILRGVEHFAIGLWLSTLALSAPKADVILVHSPPLPLSWMICWVGRLRHIPVVVNIQDLFPREAVELGMLTNPVLIRIFEAMERQMYHLAKGLTVHSPGNEGHVIQSGGRGENVHVVYNWVDTERIQPGERCNEFARKYGLDNGFVVSYAGTMGWAQDMETIIGSAIALRDCKDILFLLVGDGVEKEKAQATSTKLGLSNISWLPMQPWSIYTEILAASDVSMINLHPDLRTPVVPSKLLSIMAAARPVVASLPAESDARRIVAEAGCGICVEAGDSIGLANAIQTLESKRGLAKEMGERGRKYVEAHFSREVCAHNLEAVLLGAVGGI